MDRPSVEVYERRSDEWVAQRTPYDLPRARAFAELAPGGSAGRWTRPVADLGCGPGWYAEALGHPVVALDAARAMVERTRATAPSIWPVQADLEALPFRSGSLGGALALRSYVHLPRTLVPLALADLHRCLAPESPVELAVFEGDEEHAAHHDDEFAGRRFSKWPRDLLAHVVEGAGFDAGPVEVTPSTGGHQLTARGRRATTLPDVVGPGMRLLICGLNPSRYAAEAGVGYARPGNRFWPAAVAAGIVSRDRDARHALRHHRVGMTDVVKRATIAAAELHVDEYRTGVRRLEALCRWLRPGAICFVGLAGWRAAIDRGAVAGVQGRLVGGTPAYLMPSTSGLNAHARLPDLVGHLRAAAELAGRAAGR